MTESTVHEILRDALPLEQDTFGGLIVDADVRCEPPEAKWQRIRDHVHAREAAGTLVSQHPRRRLPLD